MKRAIWVATLTGAVGVQLVQAQLPVSELHSIFPRGGRQGDSVKVEIRGKHLSEVKGLWFSHPDIQSKPIGKGNDKEDSRIAHFQVTVPKGVRTGFYDVRAFGRYGISNPQRFVVNPEPQTTEPDTNHVAKNAAPINKDTWVNGHADEEKLDWFRFQAEKGRRLLIECWARRLGSPMDATLVLHGPSGKELIRDRNSYYSDPFIDFTAPESGEYRLKLYDFLYRGGKDYSYRFRVHTGAHVDFILPLAGRPKSRQSCLLYGRNLPEGKSSRFSDKGSRSLAKQSVSVTLPNRSQANNWLTSVPLPFPEMLGTKASALWLGRQGETVYNPALVFLADSPVTLEHEPNDTAQEVERIDVPVEVNGRFYPGNDVDRFEFQAKQGEPLWIEVQSNRLGWPTDPRVRVEQADGDTGGNTGSTQVVEKDDTALIPGQKRYNQASRDPGLMFIPKQDGRYRIRLEDLYGNGGSLPSYVYRLQVRQPQPDFQLLAASEWPGNDPDEARFRSPLLRKGGSVGMRLFVIRREGFKGPIKVHAQDLPAGVSSTGVTIPSGQTQGVLVLTAKDDIASWHGTISVVGEASVEGTVIEREAKGASLLWEVDDVDDALTMTRLSDGIALGVTDQERAPLVLRPGPDTPVNFNGPKEAEVSFVVETNAPLTDELEIRPIGLKGLDNDPETTLDKDEREGTLTFKWSEPPRKDASERRSFYLIAEGSVGYQADESGEEEETDVAVYSRPFRLGNAR